MTGGSAWFCSNTQYFAVTLFFSVEAAVSAFAKVSSCSLLFGRFQMFVFHQSRPPGIYKQHYLEELMSRYSGNMEEVSVPGNGCRE